MMKRLIFPIGIALLLSSCAAPAVSEEMEAKFNTKSGFTAQGNKGELLYDINLEGTGSGRLRLALDIDAPEGVAGSVSVVLGDKVIASKDVRGKGGRIVLKSREAVEAPCSFKVLADICCEAPEGAVLKAEVAQVRVGGDRIGTGDSMAVSKEVLLTRQCLFRPGDYGSSNYRIPAVISLPDGSVLAVNDRRKYNETDLPEDIDIVFKRSEDLGKTWSEPGYIIRGEGYGKGYGDAALVVAGDGAVLCAFSGGAGVWASTTQNPQRNYICRSTDGGRTWDEPRDVTALIWDVDGRSKVPGKYHSAFFSSGNGLVLRNGPHAGRIIYTLSLAKAGYRLDNFAFYSDDNGHSWTMSELAYSDGDESKVVELSDGTVLMSVRQNGQRGWSRSGDGGRTWTESGKWPDMKTNACNGDLIRLDDGTLLHSLTNSMQREKVSLFVSKDEGRSWKPAKCICPYESVYSSLTVLKDGTIGAYIEENPDGACSLWFMSFSKNKIIK